MISLKRLLYNKKDKDQRHQHKRRHSAVPSSKRFTLRPYSIQNGYGNEPTIVHTSYGDILGYKTDLARVFYGIPFAQPPVEKLRWNPPVPITEWSPKIINATIRAPACPQPPCNPASPSCPPYFSEDCLYLNVFTPLSTKQSHASPLPVMIFIPGGEFQYLDASLPSYNSEHLVNTTNVIVVFIQYRLDKDQRHQHKRRHSAVPSSKRFTLRRLTPIEENPLFI
ncbi:unnamed protein product [Adineta steineri]|uniref:Carboxylesterase type B domain-containing protein n=1 Tax=Adineta steineri TaxID=433720 RepID=A0A814UL61_9BILA|nr:unnamed protein product [Adineta steineri]